MGMMESAVMAGNKAIGAIKAGLTQAKTYSTHPRMLQAKRLAGEFGRGITSSKSWIPTGAVGAGIAGGVGYDALTNRNSDWRSKARAGIGGGLAGSIAGAGYYGVQSGRGMLAARGMTAKSAMGAARSYGSGMMGKARSAMGY